MNKINTRCGELGDLYIKLTRRNKEQVLRKKIRELWIHSLYKYSDRRIWEMTEEET